MTIGTQPPANAARKIVTEYTAASEYADIEFHESVFAIECQI
jgi:hypothetical protein